MTKQTESRKKGTLPPGWYDTKEAASYAGVAPRTVRKWFKRGLRHVEMSKKTKLTKRDYIDDFINGFNPVDKASVQQIVADAYNKVVKQKSTTGNKGAAPWE